MAFFYVTGLLLDEDGSATAIDTIKVEASDRKEAEQKAYDELWDERLRGGGGCWGTRIIDASPDCEQCPGSFDSDGECNHCGAPVCQGCHEVGACCDGGAEDGMTVY